MARNASGTYSRAVDPYVNGAVIDAEDHNDEHDDFGAEITDSLNRSGKGGMLAALKLANGTLASPGAHFTGQTNTGFYLNAAGDLRIALTAADIARFTAALVRIETALFVNGGVEGNSLLVSGNAQCGTLTVDAAATVGTTLDVAGEAECGTLDCLGNGAVGGTLAVTQGATVGFGLAVGTTFQAGGASTFLSTVAVTGLLTCTAGADMTNDKIVNVANGTNSGDAVNKSQLDTETARGHSTASFHASQAPLAVGTIYYMLPGWANALTGAGAETAYWIAPAAGVIRDLRVWAEDASVGVATTINARINAVGSALTATLSAATQSAADTTNAPAVAAGDRISIQLTTGAGATAPGRLTATFRFVAS